MSDRKPKRLKQFVTEVGVKSVPKAILKQNKFQFREDFNFSAAVYIQKANINNGAPEICLTISAGHHKITLKSKENTEQINDGIAELYSWIRESAEMLDKILREEQETYYNAQEQERKKLKEQNIIALKIAK